MGGSNSFFNQTVGNITNPITDPINKALNIGENSIISKPLGVGDQSVAYNPANISPLHSGTVAGQGDIYGGNSNLSQGQNIQKVIAPIPKAINDVFLGNGSGDNPISTITPAQVEAFMNKGEAKGELLTGSTLAEAGEGRKKVRDTLQQNLEGDSIAVSGLKQDQSQRIKELKANQLMSGGSQMNEGQRMSLERQADLDLARFKGAEQRQTLSDLSSEFRGVGGDIMKSTGQYGSVLVASQPSAVSSGGGGGLLSSLFG